MCYSWSSAQLLLTLAASLFLTFQPPPHIYSRGSKQKMKKKDMPHCDSALRQAQAVRSIETCRSVTGNWGTQNKGAIRVNMTEPCIMNTLAQLTPVSWKNALFLPFYYNVSPLWKAGSGLETPTRKKSQSQMFWTGPGIDIFSVLIVGQEHPVTSQKLPWNIIFSI